MDPYLLQLRVTRGDVETTCDGDEFQMEERVVRGSGRGKAWDSFEDETLAIKKVCDDGAKRSENAFGISFAFARPIVCKWLTGEAHEEQIDVGHPSVEREVRSVAADDFVARGGESRGDLIDFDVSVGGETDEFSCIQHASCAATEFDGQILVLRV